MGCTTRRDGGRGSSRACALIKWSEDRSSAVPAAPRTLLEAVRDEVGRLNRTPRKGEDVIVAVTVFTWDRTWMGRRKVGVELAGRTRSGQLLWAGLASLRLSTQYASSAADGEDVLVARQLVDKLRKELGL